MLKHHLAVLYGRDGVQSIRVFEKAPLGQGGGKTFEPEFPEEIRDRIFYPLVSGRDGGSGLGLSLAQSFIEQHQGMIDVDSRPGRTCFTILLPISDRV